MDKLGRRQQQSRRTSVAPLSTRLKQHEAFEYTERHGIDGGRLLHTQQSL